MVLGILIESVVDLNFINGVSKVELRFIIMLAVSADIPPIILARESQPSIILPLGFIRLLPSTAV